MKLRRAELTDVPRVMEIMGQAVARMAREGRPQWDESYPATEHIVADVISGIGYVMESTDGGIVAYAALVTDGEPVYNDIENGDWLTADKARYLTVHRLAVGEDCACRGTATLLMKAVADMAGQSGFSSVRADTRDDNAPMLRVLDKSGFEYCGVVHYGRGERLAFELLV